MLWSDCMKKTALTLLGLLAITGSVMAISPEPKKDAKPAAAAPTAEAKDIVDTALSTGMHNTLAAAIKAAGLVETLKGKGPFTVFAPTDEAFKKLPAGTVESLLKPENKDKLVAILTYHVIPGSVKAADVVKMKESSKTVQGSTFNINVKDGKVSIGNDKAMANVIKTDVIASNGVIHVIDAVILPPDAAKKGG
jgi:uncharacterized surface protein with fasciclin (FAS1) repeats